MVSGAIEVATKDGTWTFDFATVRITPAAGAHPLRTALGALTIPLTAVHDAAWEPARKGGVLRLHPRPGADPLRHATGGRLPDAADPLRLTVGPDTTATATAFADAVRDARALAGIGDGPVTEYLVPGPRVPLSVDGEDGNATFDGDRVRIDWGWAADKAKTAAGPRDLPLPQIDAVEWTKSALRFRVRGVPATDPAHDPNCLRLWGFKKDIGHSALLAAAVTARLPHPATPPDPAPAQPADADVVLRRLRELGELRRDGVLTDEEFTAAKQKLLGRL
ncbi:DUF4429 domain-containing protein [Actinokineospora soli]|uniref:DUF4429 domain-containing protein n=1 Tax=Actinokineospora soli TaxID=1048753 RepID=A0ABW2TNB4_9PSEU